MIIRIWWIPTGDPSWEQQPSIRERTATGDCFSRSSTAAATAAGWCSQCSDACVCSWPSRPPVAIAICRPPPGSINTAHPGEARKEAVVRRGSLSLFPQIQKFYKKIWPREPCQFIFFGKRSLLSVQVDIIIVCFTTEIIIVEATVNKRSHLWRWGIIQVFSCEYCIALCDLYKYFL